MSEMTPLQRLVALCSAIAAIAVGCALGYEVWLLSEESVQIPLSVVVLVGAIILFFVWLPSGKKG